MAYQKNNKKVAGIAFRPEVLAYLDEFAAREGRTRSNFINQLAREHAERNGIKLDSYIAKLTGNSENNTQTA